MCIRYKPRMRAPALIPNYASLSEPKNKPNHTMITCVIEIKEVPGKGLRVDMKPDQTDATEKEMHYAGVLDYAMQPVFDYIMQRGERSQMIESKDAESIRELCGRRVQEFDEENPR